MNKRRPSVFHTPGPGDGHVPQLLHARCLIVLFVYLAAPFHFLCCWRWENTQQYSQAFPSPFLSSQHPPPPPLFLPHAFLWPSGLLLALHLFKAFFEKETVKWFTEAQQCQWAAPPSRITHSIWLTPVQIQYEGQKWNKDVKSKSRPGRQTLSDITHTHNLAKLQNCT